MFGGDVVRSRILEVILIPVLFAWAVVLLLHRSEPGLYNAVVSRMVCKVRIGRDLVAVVATACAILNRKADSCFKLLDTQNTNVIRLLELSSCDLIAYNPTC